MKTYSIRHMPNHVKPYTVIETPRNHSTECAEYSTLSAAQYAMRTKDWNLHRYAATRSAELLTTIKGQLNYLQTLMTSAEKQPLDDASLIPLSEITERLQRVALIAGTAMIGIPAIHPTSVRDAASRAPWTRTVATPSSVPSA